MGITEDDTVCIAYSCNSGLKCNVVNSLMLLGTSKKYGSVYEI